MKNIWISKEIINWNFEPSGGIGIEPEYKQRGYEIWNHANELIENPDVKFNLEDGIINLKRALDQRLKLIELIYKFKENDKDFRKIPYLELLEKFGVIRNNMMKKLLQIRNSIEHYDENAPDKERCMELSDMVWYFLKATDEIVSVKRQYVELMENYDDYDEGGYGGDLRINYDKGINIEFSGWIPKKLIKDNEEDAILIKAKDCHNKAKFANIYSDLHKDRLDSDLWISGEFKLNKEDSLKFIKKIFII